LLACGDIPHLELGDAVVVENAFGEQFTVVGKDRESAQELLSESVGAHPLARGDIPKIDKATVAASGQGLAIGRERQGSNGIFS
jgi:hypothetical protein